MEWRRPFFDRLHSGAGKRPYGSLERLKPPRASGHALCVEIAYKHICEWRLISKAPPGYNGTAVPSEALTGNLNTTWAGEGVDEDTAFPLFPGKPACIQILGQESVFFKRNPISNTCALGAALNRQFGMRIEIKRKCGGDFHKPPWYR